MLKPLNQISKFSVVLGAILLTTMGIGLAPARATMLRESNSLMLHPAFMGINFGSSFDSKSKSGTDPTVSTTTGAADPVSAPAPTTTGAADPASAPTPTTTGSTDPVSAPEPTYTVGILAFGVLGLGFAWKAFARTK
ncbi:MAG: hypothetical protein JOZ78_19385 [Chroococcidiopsidaceae cyanobacterium CP_BM_ER_R8_30]|nr:hypothetical protein [Chroococcidiopsidaceae cyanobacterium CP_BM_ER_R8_30]